MSIRLLLTAAVATPLLMPAADAGTVAVGAFNRLELHGGGHVTLRHGATQSVSIIKGSADVTSFTIQNGNELVIAACGNTVIMCPWHYDLDVEITMPDIRSISVHGGGEVEAEGSFPEQESLAVDVHGGGDLDVSAISVKDVTAEVHGGGDAKLTATRNLIASVHGGGDLVYRGHPAVTQSVHGGGSIEGE